MIKTEKLCKKFGSIQAVDCISLTIDDNSIFGLAGTNGAGKSTFLRMLSGVLKPDSGKIEVDEAAVYENPKIKEEIFFLPDTSYFFQNATIEDMADFYSAYYPRYDRKRMTKLLGKISLDSKRKISTFSKGMKRQAGLILGICAGTRYLFCDETFDGLDPVMRQAAKSLLAYEVANRTFTPIIASHNLRELEDICDGVGLLHEGKLLLTEDLDQIKCNICKLQCVIPDTHKEQELIRSLHILKMERSGSVLTLTVRGERGQVLGLAQEQEPLFAEALPLTLEEIFISETEVAGYDIKDFLY